MTANAIALVLRKIEAKLVLEAKDNPEARARIARMRAAVRAGAIAERGAT